jgi:Putative serine dehydratase domain
MRLLLDEHLPIGLSAELHGHAADTISGLGWTGIRNGELLRRMSGQYDALVTMDRSIEFQQRISTLPFWHCAHSRPIQPHGGSQAARAIDPLRSQRGRARPHSPSRLVTNNAAVLFSPVTHNSGIQDQMRTNSVDTQLQCGSCIFMDADYGRDRDGAPTKAFEPSLFVWTTVMSRPTEDRAIVNAGLKALAFDSDPPLVCDEPPRPTSAPRTSTEGSPSRPPPTGSRSATRSG